MSNTTFPLEETPQWCVCCHEYTFFVWNDYYICVECGTFLGNECEDTDGN